jgi:hypothetical protein
VRRVLFVIALVLLATPGSASAAPTVKARPSVVGFGETLTIRGSGWPVIEFCSRNVRLSLRSAQNAFRIGTVRTRTNGRFTFRFVPRRSQVGAGRWTVVARMRCESGKDGSPIIRRARDRIRIARGPFILASPRRVDPGELVRVSGRVPGCSIGNQVTLISRAFPAGQEFAGVPAVFTTLRASHRFSVRVRIPSGRNPGRYGITGRCGGGRFADTTLRVKG